MTTTPDTRPATADCPQCGHEVETVLYVRSDGAAAYVYGQHCPECDEAVAMDVNFEIPEPPPLRNLIECRAPGCGSQRFNLNAAGGVYCARCGSQQRKAWRPGYPRN